MYKKLQVLKPAQTEEGFTLIELMIVVVIIGILAAVAIPIFASQQRNADYAALQSDVKNTALAANTAKATKGSLPKTCDEWKAFLPSDWKSSDTRFIRVRVSPDNFNFWIEAQSYSLPDNATAGPDEVAKYTAQYNSARADGVISRAAYAAKYGVSLSSQAVGAGYTNTGFIMQDNTCSTW